MRARTMDRRSASAGQRATRDALSAGSLGASAAKVRKCHAIISATPAAVAPALLAL
jgi:hypothetical protein